MRPDWTPAQEKEWKPTSIICKLCDRSCSDTDNNQDPWQVWLRHAQLYHPDRMWKRSQERQK